jgi:hypothetical protein
LLRPRDFGWALWVLKIYALATPGVDLGNALTFLQALQINPGSLAILAILGQFGGFRFLFLLGVRTFHSPLPEFRFPFGDRFLLGRAGAAR